MSANPESSSSAALTKLLPIGIIVVVVLVVLYFFLASGPKAPAPTAAKPGAPAAAAKAPAPAEAAAAAASDALPELTPQQLLKEASDAMREKRFVAPAGNNAFEYYERLLDKDPGNQTASDALRETFPMVIGVPEQEINAGNLDEATRIINLLAKADPNNYTLTILRSKLDAKRKAVDREQAQAAAAAAAAAAAKAQAAQAAAAAAAQAQAAQAAQGANASTSTAEAEQAAPAASKAAGTNGARAAAKTVAKATPPPAPAAPVGETHPAEIIKGAPPDYPPDAVRRRQQGWVEVEFTVMPDGSVANASVVNANPARVFNSAALSAVGRWTFKPRMENGKAVEERVRRRIEFKF